MKQKRSVDFKDVDVSAVDESGKKFIRGVIPYNKPSRLMFGVTEIISETAFLRSLSGKSEIHALFNHNYNHVLGSSRSGTLTLTSSSQGLDCLCELPDTTYARDLYAVVQRGDVKTMSFSFIDDDSSYDKLSKTRTLLSVELFEVSFGVPIAAYPDTTSGVFSRDMPDFAEVANILTREEICTEDGVIIESFISGAQKILQERSTKNKSNKPDETPKENRDGADMLVLELEAENETLAILNVSK